MQQPEPYSGVGGLDIVWIARHHEGDALYGPAEIEEGRVDTNVIRNQYTTAAQRRPDGFELEHHCFESMFAVVNERIEFAQVVDSFS